VTALRKFHNPFQNAYIKHLDRQFVGVVAVLHFPRALKAAYREEFAVIVRQIGIEASEGQKLDALGPFLAKAHCAHGGVIA
jgi:hypothetical protein